MEPTVIAALCSAIAAIVGAALGYIAHNKDISETNKVLVYKVDELIKDVKSLAGKFDEYNRELSSLRTQLNVLETEQTQIEKRLEALEKGLI